MNVKLEDQASEVRIKDLKAKAEKILDIVPAEHLRGLTKVVFVDLVTEPRLSAAQRSTLPALYHPKMTGRRRRRRPPAQRGCRHVYGEDQRKEPARGLRTGDAHRCPDQAGSEIQPGAGTSLPCCTTLLLDAV